MTVFQVNFLSDFLKLFPPKYNGAKISDIIFPTLPEKVGLTKEQKKALATERKKKRLELKEKFGYTIVDGVKTEIANWVVEPPGLFMGRGRHPIRGRWKPSIQEENITLNLDKHAPTPPGKWKVIHEPQNMWIACWTDKLSDKVKYVLASRLFQHQADARQKQVRQGATLGEKHVEKVRAYISKSMGSKDPKEPGGFLPPAS